MKKRTQQAGYSAIEMLVVVAMIMALTYGSSSVMYSLMKTQVSSRLSSVLVSMKTQTMNCLVDPKGFFATLVDPVNFAPTSALFRCLNVPGSCYAYSTATQPTIPLRLNGSAAALNPQKTAWAYYTCGGYDTLPPNSGFTRTGSFCSTFSTTNPDPNCPFRYQVSWKPECIDTECRLPRFTFYGELLNTGSDVINTETYSLKYSASANTVPVKQFGAAFFTDSQVPGGRCNPGKWTPRLFNVVNYDSDFGSPAGTPGNQLLWGQIYFKGVSMNLLVLQGEYICNGWASAFSVGKHRVRLKVTDKNGTRYVYGTNGYSSDKAGYLSTTSEVHGKISLASVGSVELEHYCETSHGPFDFGRAVGTGEPSVQAPNTHNSLDCVRMR